MQSCTTIDQPMLLSDVSMCIYLVVGSEEGGGGARNTAPGFLVTGDCTREHIQAHLHSLAYTETNYMANSSLSIRRRGTT